jgi:hypothetical protein
MTCPKLISLVVAAALCITPPSAGAHYTGGPSDASAVSLLPVAVSVAAPAVLLSAGAALTVVAVEASAQGTVWILESASDGARVSVELAGNVLVGVGTAVAVSAIGTGWVLSAAGEAIAFIPNELGGALLYNERVSR